LAALFILFFSGVSFAQTERILDFHSDITINPDASMVVSETIKVESTGDQIKRGIYRDFPTKYKDKYGTNYKIGFEIVGIERDRANEPYHTEGLSNGIRIYIGSANYYLDPGIYTYKITYKTTRQLGFFKDYDELYWNVTGNGWAFPIEHASAAIAIPNGASVLNTSAYTGYQGDKGEDFRASTKNEKVYFETTRALRQEEGLTVAVAWPKGFVPEPTESEKRAEFIKDNLGLITGTAGIMVLLFYYLLIWFIVGRDPKKGTIVPFFGPPKDISPAAMRMIMNMGFDQKCFIAAIVDMAVKKSITIEEEGGSYTLKQVEQADVNALSEDEKSIFKDLIAPEGQIDLFVTNHVEISGAIEKLKNILKKAYEKAYFFSNAHFWSIGILLSIAVLVWVSLIDITFDESGLILFLILWISIWSIGVVFLLSSCFSGWKNFFASADKKKAFKEAGTLTLFALPFFLAEIGAIAVFVFFGSKIVPILAVVVVVINALFYHLLKAPTLLGRQIMDQIEGFKLYLGTAEKDRLNFFNQPGKSPDLFEKFLPYAIALGVENKWAEYFSDEFKKAAAEGHAYSPSWYRGTGFASLGAVGLASSLSSSFMSAVSSAARAPSSSSGSSGSFGGGSSGGGGGGGGGGGW